MILPADGSIESKNSIDQKDVTNDKLEIDLSDRMPIKKISCVSLFEVQEIFIMEIKEAVRAETEQSHPVFQHRTAAARSCRIPV